MSDKITRKQVEKFSSDSYEIAKSFGLNPREVNFTVIGRTNLNKIIANDGFPSRYPHWRRGMKYEQFRKKGKIGAGKVYELVLNSKPCQAYLLASNPVFIQKAVIAHVMGHSDFFENNMEYEKLSSHMNSRAVSEMERHGDIITNIINQKDTSREEVEKFIDNILKIEYNIDPYRSIDKQKEIENRDNLDEDESDYSDSLFSEDIIDRVFEDEDFEIEEDEIMGLDEKDILKVILKNGMIYDKDEGEAVEMKDWQKKILKIIRKESYYIAPQRMTKYMNEGWANYWERKIMINEKLADDDESVQFSKYVSKILNSNNGENPYNIGQMIWNHIEEKTARNELFEKLMSVKGIKPSNIFRKINIKDVISKANPDSKYYDINKENVKELLENHSDEINEEVAREYIKNPDNYDLQKYTWKLFNKKGMAKRHYCFNQYGRKEILPTTTTEKLEQIYEFLENRNKYENIEEAINDIDYERAWRKMREIRSTHTDVNFLAHFDKELSKTANIETQEGHSIEEIQKQLKIQKSNFGKPIIVVEDVNYNNSKELLLKHKYQGIGLKIETAKETLKGIYELWGRPVHLQTVKKDYDKRKRKTKELLITYNGEEIKEKIGNKIDDKVESKKELYDDYKIAQSNPTLPPWAN